MKKKTGFISLLIACFALVIICSSSYALEQAAVRSHGNVMFEGEEGSILLCGEDVDYLMEKILSIPTETYDPAYYTHLHVWEYDQVNDSTHTRQCRICGENTLKPHTPDQQDEYSISYKGNTYPGVTYTCACGYQWIREAAHNLTYVQKSDSEHVTKCELSGTEYCSGRIEAEEPHAYILVPEEDNKHLRMCRLCSFEKEEECDFTSYSEENVDQTISWYCECGNSMIASDGSGGLPERPSESETR